MASRERSGSFLVGEASPPMAGPASQGEALLRKLEQLLDKNISLAVATNSPSLAKNSTDLQVLAARGRCLSGPGPQPRGQARFVTCWCHGRGRRAELRGRGQEGPGALLVRQEGRGLGRRA